jgi:ATP-grasp domain-containing protein
MTLLILSPRYTPDSAALWKAAIQLGWSVERLQSHRPPDRLRDVDLAIYGEALFTNIVADELDFTLLEPTFDWVARLPEAYRQREIRYTTFKETRAITHPTFIKPAYDKSFDAQVYEPGFSQPVFEHLPGDLPVLIAEPVSWETEFRCFVLEREVQTISIYSRHGELAEGDEGTWSASQAEIEGAIGFTRLILQDAIVDMPPAFVMDVGQITNRGWAVVEANPAWASGIYGCDPTKILPVLKRSCLKREALSASDSRWVLERLV